MPSPTLPDSSLPEDPVAAELDNEIAALQAQIKTLKSRRSLQASIILSSHTTQRTLHHLYTSQKTSSAKQPSRTPQSSTPESSDLTPLLTTSTLQTQHNTQNLYRACGSITSFRIRDPDPHAVDNGNVLGIRIDVSSNGKFGKSYYVMLNKPFEDAEKELLRIHRHTLPPCIPLASLAQRYLPHGKGAVAGKAVEGSKAQNLQKFTRALRREIVAYHNRISTIKALRKEFALDEKPSKKGKERQIEKVIADITAADAEAKQIKIEWTDGRIGRVLVGEQGEVLRCVVIGEGGRERDVERRVVGEMGRGRMDGIGERLREGIY